MPDGSKRMMRGAPASFTEDPKLNPPKGMAVGDELGIHYNIDGKDYVVTGTGMSNQIRQAFKPIQDITSVINTGKPGTVVMRDYETDASGKVIIDEATKQPKLAARAYTGIIDEDGMFRVQVSNEDGVLGIMNPQTSQQFIDQLYHQGYQKFMNFAPSNKDLFGADETTIYNNNYQTEENE
jgi:hypothetical protein